MDDLLIKYILEEATPAESEQVQQWLAANATNRSHFERLQAVWQLASQPSLTRATDTPQALQRLKQTLQAKETATANRIRPRVWTAAAAILGIAAMAYGTYVLTKPKTTKEQPPVVQPDTVRLLPTPIDTTPMLQPALPTDTLPAVKPHKKKRPSPVTPAPPVRHKKKTSQQPTQPADTTPVKKKHPAPPAAQVVIHKKKTGRQPTVPTDTITVKKKRPVPVQQAYPVRKHKSRPVKEPPIS